jgi:2-methylcitrate dehydratase PrpD
VVDAQFSMPYGAAIALIDRAAGLDQFAVENIRSPKIKSLMEKVVLQKNKHIEKNYPREWPSIVEIHMANGKHFQKRVRFPKGDLENPLTWQELSAKFHALARRVLAKSQCDQIVKSVKGMKPTAVLRDILMLASQPNSQTQSEP